MKHVKTLNTKRLQNTVKKGGCGECQNKKNKTAITITKGRMPKACGHLHV